VANHVIVKEKSPHLIAGVDVEGGGVRFLGLKKLMNTNDSFTVRKVSEKAGPSARHGEGLQCKAGEKKTC